jgi:hypothetical protein
MQLLKMVWMLAWRFALLFAIFGHSVNTGLILAVLLAVFVRYVLHSTIRIFPLFNLFRGRKPLIDLSSKTNTTVSSESQSQNIIHKATNPGISTGYEPHCLETVVLPSTHTVRNMRGVPGCGLNESNFAHSSVQMGQMGETNFAKALAITSRIKKIDYSDFRYGIIQTVHSFWSVAMPSEIAIRKPDPKFKTDIDCILVNGNTIILVDTKFYKSGDVTYTNNGSKLYCVDNATKNLVDKPRTMTKNMQMAKERFQKFFPKMNVEAIVVFMPTDSGSAIINNVYWPGNIPAMTINQALDYIIRCTSANANTDHRVLMDIASLLK